MKQKLRYSLSKSKQKNRSETEHLRGIIREYEKEIKSLRKQLRQFEKYEQNSQDEEVATSSEDTYPDKEVLLTKDCDNCGKSKMVQTLEIMGKVYGECSLCGNKGRIL